MLQIDLQPYGSDAIEDAQRLAQTKGMNSYSFTDLMNFLNHAWNDVYQRIVQMDEGYYSETVRLTSRLTQLPAHVKNSIRIYGAQDPIGFNRTIFRASGFNDLNGPATYHISGFDLYCPDAERRRVWMNYVPQQATIFFTHRNRDPEIIIDPELQTVDTGVINDRANMKLRYNLYWLRQDPDTRPNAPQGRIIYTMEHLNQVTTAIEDRFVDITDTIDRTYDDWEVVYIGCEHPYVFVTYRHLYTGEHHSGFYKNILNDSRFTSYNPFSFDGRDSNVEYVRTARSDKTGLGVTILDHFDGQYKYLGWTPDTLLQYPTREAYRLLVARLAEKFSVLNESNVMGVQKELVEATFAFDAFMKKDKSAWQRIDNVNGPTIGDIL